MSMQLSSEAMDAIAKRAHDRLRDEFAMAAVSSIAQLFVPLHAEYEGAFDRNLVARLAYGIADAMMEARK